MIRSFLYVPGDRPSMLAKAPSRGADVLIIDLEDSVAPNAKEEARRIIGDAIPEMEAAGAELAVRVNSEPEEQEADLAALTDAGIKTLVVPKATSEALEVLTQQCRGVGLSSSLRLVALIESGRGLWEALSIAEHPQVVGLAIGEQDLAADLGLEHGADPMLWHPARSRLVWASAAAGLRGPSGPVWTDIGDLDGLRGSTRLLRKCGYSSRPAIHPAQVPVINEVFTPSEEELETARQLVDDYQQAREEGRGAIRNSQGRMIDEAVIRRARRLLYYRGR